MKNSYIYIFVQEIFADFWLTRRGRSNGEATIGERFYTLPKKKRIGRDVNFWPLALLRLV